VGLHISDARLVDRDELLTTELSNRRCSGSSGTRAGSTLIASLRHVWGGRWVGGIGKDGDIVNIEQCSGVRRAENLAIVLLLHGGLVLGLLRLLGGRGCNSSDRDEADFAIFASWFDLMDVLVWSDISKNSDVLNARSYNRIHSYRRRCLAASRPRGCWLILVVGGDGNVSCQR
jgi:hypothetical protein